jgi:hypothetical protein
MEIGRVSFLKKNNLLKKLKKPLDTPGPSVLPCLTLGKRAFFGSKPLTPEKGKKERKWKINQSVLVSKASKRWMQTTSL